MNHWYYRDAARHVSTPEKIAFWYTFRNIMASLTYHCGSWFLDIKTKKQMFFKDISWLHQYSGRKTKKTYWGLRVCCRRCIKITETTEKGLRSCPIMLNTGRGDLCWSRTRCRQDSYTIVPVGGANNHLCAIKFGISEAGVRGGIEIRGLRFPVVAPHLG